MRILFLLSILLFMYSVIRFKKSNKEQNILLWIILSIIIMMSFNSIIVFILSYLDIVASLFIRSIIFIINSLILLIICRKDKQKYYFSYYDFCMFFVILCVSFLVFGFRFGLNIDLNFKMNDAIVHYKNADVFYNYSLLTDKIEEDSIMYESNYGNVSLFFSYTNIGTLFQLCDNIVGEYNLYKLFVLFEMFSFYIGGILFYFLIKKDNISNMNYLLTIVFIILYMLGYPLLNLLMGFSYWHLSLIITMSLLILIKLFFDMNKNKNIVIIILSLLSFSLFSTYYLFVPVVYLIIGLYILSKYKIDRVITLKKSILYISIILVIPFILGMIYYFLYPYLSSDSTASSIMTIEGYNYCNLIGNFILFIPLVIWKVIDEIKNKKCSLELIGLLITILYTIVLFILCLLDKLSIYYYYKIYLYLWLFNYVYLIKCLYEFKFSFVKVYLYSYVVIILLGVFNIEQIIIDNKNGITNNNIIAYLTDIYKENIDTIRNENPYLDNNKKEIINYVMDNYDTLKNIRGEVPFIAPYFDKIWYSEIYKIYVSNNFHKRTEYYINDIKNIEEDNDTKYIVWLYYENSKVEIDINNYNIIYENNGGCILEKKY